MVEILHLDRVREFDRNLSVKTTSYEGGVFLGLRAEVPLKVVADGEHLRQHEVSLGLRAEVSLKVVRPSIGG